MPPPCSWYVHDGRAYSEVMRTSELADRAEAALELASRGRFGAPPGQLPAMLHQIYEEASGQPPTRARLAAALARTWAYSNDADRGAPFALEAEDIAVDLGDPVVLADALDARLTTRWGPDDLDERRGLSARLLDVVAHIADPVPRLRAYLWRLITGLETLDAGAVRRQLAALDVLADETDDDATRFFASSRRAMFRLAQGKPAGVEELIDATERAGTAAGLVDADAVLHTLRAELAREREDRRSLHAEAAAFEDYGAAQGIASILGEAAVLWLESGDTDRAEQLVDQLAAGLDELPRDVDWLLVVAKLCQAAVGTGHAGVAQRCAELLAPCVGRAVINSGAVAFAGVVDDYVALAWDDTDLAARARDAYAKLGAGWWAQRGLRRNVPTAQVGAGTPTILHLHPTNGGGPTPLWCVGRDGATRLMPQMQGLRYLQLLLERPGIDLPALDLSAVVHGTAPLGDSDAGPLLDRQAIASYRERLHHLDVELARADVRGDAGGGTRLAEERDALLAQIGAAVGMRGPRLASSHAERARVAVRKAIATALDRLELYDAGVAHALRTTVHTGATCRYDPDPLQPVRWRATAVDTVLS